MKNGKTSSGAEKVRMPVENQLNQQKKSRLEKAVESMSKIASVQGGGKG